MGKSKGRRLNKKIIAEMLQTLFQQHPNEVFTIKQVFKILKLDTHPTRMLAIDIMEEMGMSVGVIRAGAANMFQSKIFRDTLSSVTGAVIELLDTDGAAGAARGAGIGAGIYSGREEAFATLKRIDLVEPSADRDRYLEAYSYWKNQLDKQ